MSAPYSRLALWWILAAIAVARPCPTRAQEAVRYSRQSDVIYGRKFGMALTMDVLVPPTPNGLAVIWIVSSGGVSDPNQISQPGFDRRLAPFLRHGHTVFVVLHGSSPRFQIDEYAQDAARAVRFVRYHATDYGIDPEKIAIAGSSSGGYIALMVGLDARDPRPETTDPADRVATRVQAVGAFFPPTDLVRFGDASDDVITFMRERYGVVDPAFQLFATDSSGARERVDDEAALSDWLRRMSPVEQVSSDDPPTILIHGDQDALVPVQQSLSLAEGFSRVGVASRLVVREGRGHAWDGWESDAELVADWFDDHLGSP